MTQLFKGKTVLVHSMKTMWESRYDSTHP